MADPTANAGPSERTGARATNGQGTTHPYRDDATDVAEVACLGAALLSAEARTGLRRMLTPRDFARDAHGVVWDVLGQLEDAGTPVDLVTLTAALADRDLLDEVGGPGAVSTLTSPEACPSPAAWPAYALPVLTAARRRRLRTVLRGALRQLDNGADPNVLADELAREVVPS
jgi:replicative DNA helicase